MKILGLDTSTETGGAALMDGDRLLGEYTLAVGRTTHSERLLPAVARLLQDAGLGTFDDELFGGGPGAEVGGVGRDGAGRRAFAEGEAPVDGIAVVLGPGSFTGLRIGVVTAKALAYAWNVPVAGVSTLEALAYQAAGGPGLICPLLDARNGNVYGAVYDRRDGELIPVQEPGLRAVADWLPSLQDALGEMGFADGPVVFTGDGVPLYWDDIRRHMGARAARVGTTFTQLRSGAVAALGRRRIFRGDVDDPMGLAPVYLRKSEAERKWEQRQSNNRSNL